MKMGNSNTATSEVSECGLYWKQITPAFVTTPGTVMYTVPRISPMLINVFAATTDAATNYIEVYIEEDPAITTSIPAFTVFMNGPFQWHTGYGDQSIAENAVKIYIKIYGSIGYYMSYAVDKTRV